jgi:O-succinylbenzoic acid--CoA ligase
MANSYSLEHLEHQLSDDWLICPNNANFTEWRKRRFQELEKWSNNSGDIPTILVTELHPEKFLASFLTAIQYQCPVFLGNPQWAIAEWQQVLEMTRPDLIWGVKGIESREHGVSRVGVAAAAPAVDQDNLATKGRIMIPTGGSSGRIRFAVHTWETLMAAVRGFQQFFQVEQINSCCVLPLYHVSGLMQALRSLTTNGQLIVLPFKSLFEEQPAIAPHPYFLSLVPTQLQQLLQYPTLVDWLKQFHVVFLGGAPSWDTLRFQARQHQIPVALTYGMTETAAQVVTLKPQDFLRGDDSVGQVLPHARVVVGDRPDQPCLPNQVGTIHLQAASLCLGYLPSAVDLPMVAGYFQTDDVGFFDQTGYLHIFGRRNRTIITGGENVHPVEIEVAILSTGLVLDVYVFGVPDPVWGEAIVAVYVPLHAQMSPATLQFHLGTQLSRFKWPKHWRAVESIPRSEQGKVQAEQLQKLISL